MIRLTAIALVAMATTAQAQPAVPVPKPKPAISPASMRCMERSEMIAWLLSAKQGRKQLRWFGLRGVGSMLELYANSEGEFAVVVSPPGGKSCLVDSGDGGTLLRPMPVGDPA